MPIDELLVSENVVDTTKELVKLILPAPESRSADTIKHINVFYNFFRGRVEPAFSPTQRTDQCRKGACKKFSGIMPEASLPKSDEIYFFTGLYLNLGYFHKLCQ